MQNYLRRWSNMELIFLLISAHIFGDYVFQNEYIATTKGKNYYHLFVHCFIYTFCFWCVFFSFNKVELTLLLFVFVSHFIIDFLKCRLNEKNSDKSRVYYAIDQLLHYLVIAILVCLLS